MAEESATCCSPDTAARFINVGDVDKSYTVNRVGLVRGAGELTAFDRAGNTYGMEVWVCVGQSDKASEGFVRPIAAP